MSCTGDVLRWIASGSKPNSQLQKRVSDTTSALRYPFYTPSLTAPVARDGHERRPFVVGSRFLSISLTARRIIGGMARYDVTVRVWTGWPPSASDLVAMRCAGRHLPGPLRLRSVMVCLNGDSEVVLRTGGLPPAMAIQQTRLALPLLGLRRDAVHWIDVRRVHLLRSRRHLLASWRPTAPATRSGDTPPGSARRRSHHPAAAWTIPQSPRP